MTIPGGRSPLATPAAAPPRQLKLSGDPDHDPGAVDTKGAASDVRPHRDIALARDAANPVMA